MNQHDRFMIGSLGLCWFACMAGTVLGAAIVIGFPDAFGVIACFGLTTMFAVPLGFILALCLMTSQYRWRWLSCWSTAAATIFLLVSWGIVSAVVDW